MNGFNQDEWYSQRELIVLQGNLAKFSQNQKLKEFLINTQDRVLVEASPVDKVWGIGLSVDSPGVDDPKNWRGLNLLGFALMQVRQEMKNIKT